LILTSSKLSTLTSCVPLLPYLAHFGTQEDLDIFDGIVIFHRNNASLWPMISDF